MLEPSREHATRGAHAAPRTLWAAGLALALAAGCSGAQFASATGTGGAAGASGSGASAGATGTGGAGASAGADAGAGTAGGGAAAGSSAGGSSADSGVVEAAPGCGTCQGATPLCDPKTQQCVQCLSQSDCHDPAAPACVSGSCVCPGGSVCNGQCPFGMQTCGGNRCIDLQNDASHCGSCGTQCNADQMCINSNCGCRSGLTACYQQCVDTNSDPSHCGSCTHSCNSGEVCQGGTCQTGGCTGGLTLCNNGTSCVDTQTSNLDCGQCGQACARDRICVQGSCRDYAPAVGCVTCPCPACKVIVDTGNPACCVGGGGALTCVDSKGICP